MTSAPSGAAPENSLRTDLKSRLATKSLSIFLSPPHLAHIVGLTNLLPPLYAGAIEKAKVYG